MNVESIMDAGMQSAAGMRAQGDRIRVISQNVANVDSFGLTPGADPYRRQVVTFKEKLDDASGAPLVRADKITRDMTDFALKYLPGHPGADENGYIKVPNVNMAYEMADMREAQRSYEANLSMLELSRNIMNKLVDLLRA